MALASTGLGRGRQGRDSQETGPRTWAVVLLPQASAPSWFCARRQLRCERTSGCVCEGPAAAHGVGVRRVCWQRRPSEGGRVSRGVPAGTVVVACHQCGALGGRLCLSSGVPSKC